MQSRQFPRKLFSYLVDGFAIQAINVYQRHISPHKGYSCSHRILHGGSSCSQYVKLAIAGSGLVEAMSLSKSRFKECRQAAMILQLQSNQNPNKRKSSCSIRPTCAPDCWPDDACGGCEPDCSGCEPSCE